MVFLGLILFLAAEAKAQDNSEPARLIIFHSPSCHRCVQVKQDVLPGIEKEFTGKVIFEYRDVTGIENYKMLMGLLQDNREGIKYQVPLFYLGGKFLTAEGNVGDNLRGFILKGLKDGASRSSLKEFDLAAYFKGFVPAAIIIAGLEDGVNPCAFTVIVFFISFLAVQGYRRRDLFIIGAAFILAVFLTYLGIGLGIFNFFYHFQGFWVVARLLNLVIGISSLLFGILAIYDFIKFRKTGKTDDLILQLPGQVKNRIHKVIGFFYRKSEREKQEKILPSPGRLVFSALVTGFLVSLLEAVCTGQMYLPAISFVLKASSLKIQALGYLLLYNIMFVVPLIVILILALLGVSSAQFAGFLKKRLGLIKILMAVLFLGLGVFLIWRA